MTDCRFAQRVPDYVEGRLAGPDLGSFEEHLPGCADCAEQVRRLRKLDELLRDALRESKSIDVIARVEKAIEKRQSKPVRIRRRRLIHVAGAGLAAASVLVVLWLAGVFGHAQDPSRRALADGSAWLMRTQESDGHWDSKAHGAGVNFDIGVTGLSVLALMETHEKTNDPEALGSAAKGATWLTGQQDRLGRFLRSHDQSRMYGQAVATLALLRVYEKQPGEALRTSIEKALAFGVLAQSKAGGWSYVPGITADTSHTGWFVLALSRARSDGFKVPETVIVDAIDYVNGMTDSDGQVSYNVPGNTHPGLTGTPIAVNMTMGERVLPASGSSGVHASVRKLLDTPPDWNDRQQSLYLWFFASQGFKSVSRGAELDDWMRDLAGTLVAHQDRSDTPDRGSWSNNDTPQADAGRIYSTSLALVCIAQSR